MWRFLTRIIISLIIIFPFCINAQIVDNNAEDKILSDSIKKEFDDGPYFTLFKDNYFLVGTELGKKPTSDNSDVKFQISISQRITKSILPFGTYLYLTYSQKCFWHVFKESLPMYDLNFNPGIGIAKPLFNKGKYIGKVSLMLEHESNGKDSIWSRSWNKISLGANVMITENLMVHGKVWIPIIDGQNNKDILDYCGIWQSGVSYTTSNKRFGWALTLVKRKGWNINHNIIFEFNWRFLKKGNQYLFLQYYNGYGEGLLDYKKHHNRIRVGIVIKPKFFSEF